MSIGQPGIPARPPGATEAIPDHQPKGPGQNVSADDAKAFDTQLSAEQTAVEEKKLTPEEELKKLMSEQAVKQFMERSKEHTDEAKKNFEG